jgi:hypothetical protein
MLEEENGKTLMTLLMLELRGELSREKDRWTERPMYRQADILLYIIQSIKWKRFCLNLRLRMRMVKHCDYSDAGTQRWGK